MKYNLVTPYDTYSVTIERKQYGNGRTALQIVDSEDGSPVMTATVNLPDEHLEENEVAIKDWSENTGILSFLQGNNIISKVKREVRLQFVTAQIVDLL